MLSYIRAEDHSAIRAEDRSGCRKTARLLRELDRFAKAIFQGFNPNRFFK